MDLRQLSNLDLNLLTVFSAVEQHRHVTRAAAALGLSQPAVSHALGRLRELFQDPLFVKTRAGMVPTPRAEQLSEPVRRILELIAGEVIEPEPVALAAMERVFRIATTDLVEFLLAPTLIARIADEAPSAQLSFSALSFELPRHALESGRADLAIAGFFGELPAGYYQQKLFRDRFLSCVRRTHPLAGKRVSKSAYAAAEHVLIAPSGELRGTVDRLLAGHKRKRRVIAGTSGFLVSGWVVAASDCVLTAPARLVEKLAETLPLALFTPPVKVPPIEVVQVWHERNHRAPEHRWLRQAVRDTLADS